MQFINLTTLIPDLVLDLRYSSTNNVCNKKISDFKKPYLLAPAAYALREVSNLLRITNNRLVIWDAGRTRATQLKLRTVCDQEEYVADVSKHNAGLAVDVSLANENGQIFDMGTDFDDFSPRAWANNTNFNQDVMSNRRKLLQAMISANFVQCETEWWHFEFEDINHSNISKIRIEDYVFA